MLTRLHVRNFKTLDDVSVELGRNVVLVGPNNSGKTTALQALSLWQSGMREWLARRGGSKAKERTGVTLNRRALTHTPVREARFLWRNLRLSHSGAEARNGGGRVKIEITLEGQRSDGAWCCGLEFDYANPESIYCRPLRAPGDDGEATPDLPAAARDVRLAYLPPMSGLVTEEAELQPGRLDVLIGEGRTAEVLRNLCLQVYAKSPADWARIEADMERMFRMRLHAPERDPARGEVDLLYRQDGCDLDIASAGRGAQQVLLLLAHLRFNPGAVLLLDEPDAHLEILRQRSVYALLTNAAGETGSQIVAASHSEVVLNEAADRDVVVAFVGRPHRIDDRGAQLLKALRDIGSDEYYQAARKGWVLYLEGSTDLAILQAWAEKLGHPAAERLAEPYVHFVGNRYRAALSHFFGLREAEPDLRAFALFDRLDSGRAMPPDFTIPHHVWSRREIECYLATPAVLLRHAEGEETDDLVGRAHRDRRRDAMQGAIDEIGGALRTLGEDPWGPDIKASERLLPPIFAAYFRRLRVPDRTNKSGFHILASAMLPDEIAPEVKSVLDEVHRTLSRSA
jgi:predicted ATPase